MMNNPLKNQIITQISALKETPFENFVTELMLMRYGENGFITIRDKSDEGCDGIIIEDNEVIACYGPLRYNKTSFNKKAKDDFDSYKKNWEQKYSNWKMVVNHDPAPQEIKKVEELKKDSKIWGIKNLVHIIEDKLSSKQRRDIARYLGVDKDVIVMDYIKEVLDDLLNNTTAKKDLNYNRPIYLPDKVKLNFEESEIDNFNEEYEIFAEDGTLSGINNIIQGYEDDEINKIKIRVISDFDLIGLNTFKDKLEGVMRQYKLKYSREDDDDYNFYIKAIIIYCFEQCIIGKRTPGEK